MRAVSAAFAAAIHGSHAMRSRVRVVAAGQTGVNPDGRDIPILGGDVRLDSTADVRGTLDLTTDGNGWDPRLGRTDLAPYGNEIFVERGVEVSGGSIEYVSQGYYRLFDVEQDEAPNGPIRLTGQDRMSAIVDAKLLEPRQFPASTMASAVFNALVLEVLPSAVIDFTVADQALGRDQVTEDDRYAFLKDLADSLGAVMFFDHRGHLVVMPTPLPTADPVLTVAAGEGGVLVKASRALSRDSVYNIVVATGEGADEKTAVRGVAWDDNPSSPTYWKGDYGQVPRFYSSSLLTTAGQARSAAVALLLKSIGLPYVVDFTAVPHPGLEPLDIVRVQYGPFYGNHLVETLTIPLTADAAMTATTRQQTTITIGAA